MIWPIFKESPDTISYLVPMALIAVNAILKKITASKEINNKAPICVKTNKHVLAECLIIS